MHTNNDWFYDYFIDEVKAIRRNCVPKLQPDWNQNDDTQPDYVKNRPFYTGDPVETVLVEESAVSFNRVDGPDGSAIYVVEFPPTFEATVGETYKVSWDGTVYECTSVGGDSEIAIGNLSIMGGPDTGEPFLILVRNGDIMAIVTADASASHTFSISRTVAPVVKIDKKYLVQPDWNQNDDTNPDYVKNRPFYEEVKLFVEGNITDDNSILPESEYELGKLYIVEVDGVQHYLEFIATTTGEGMNYVGFNIRGAMYGVASIDSTKPLLSYYIGPSSPTDGLYSLTVQNITKPAHVRVLQRAIRKIDPKYLPISFKPDGKSYLTFSSSNNFTLKVNDATKHWNGTLEYFTSDRTWASWNGMTTLSAVADDGEYVLYLRGIGNTVITGNRTNYKWILTGTDIKCIGNIENLLDYSVVESGAHPMMATSCYSYMFQGCTSLTQAPALPATSLTNSCYNNMFQGCTSLTQAPALTATSLTNSCYNNMFQGCTSLTQAPALPATKLAPSCYAYMFQGCTSLTQVPTLPATTLADSCYTYMFNGCTSLTQVPALTATKLSDGCYSYMFQGCTSLTQAPALPATKLAPSCYAYMFQGCTSLTQAPTLPATILKTICYNNMFQGCTSLTQAPALPATTLANGCYNSMFMRCYGLAQVPALSATTLATACYNSMFYGCTSIKLSSTKTDEYTQEYSIPASGNGTTASNALSDMFASTGGTFTETPSINKTYYLSSDNMVVHETEIATLNGYIKSMISTALSKIGVAEEGAY